MASHGYLSVFFHAFVDCNLLQPQCGKSAVWARLCYDCTSMIAFVNGPISNLLEDLEVVDDIKKAVDAAFGKPVVSCADFWPVAARDSVVAWGPTWEVQLGRRDSTTASRDAANKDIPAPFFSLSQLIENFKNKGLDEKDLVVLSGGHTIGYARCATFRDRIYKDTDINSEFAQQLKYICPINGGLLHSDQELFNGGSTDALVKQYSYYPEAFFQDFAESMIKMGNIQPLTGIKVKLRVDCRKVQLLLVIKDK
ncbi:Plant peroxidase [Sesbania bispinosa]|nr:Plant peroxidase [Sesbania bispinosa]